MTSIENPTRDVVDEAASIVTLPSTDGVPAQAAEPVEAVAAGVDLDVLPDRDLTARELLELATAIARRPESWREHVAFSDEKRHYVSLHRDAHVDVWLLCWTPQNDTGWHDHDISCGAVAVAQGCLTEHNLAVGAPSLATEVPSGKAYCFGPEHIHRLTGARDSSVAVGEMSMFVTPRVLVTVRKDDVDLTPLIERWGTNAKYARLGLESVVMAYGLLDAIVDGHFAAAQSLEARTDALERVLFQHRRDFHVCDRAYFLGGRWADLRRVVAPTHEIAARFVRNDTVLVAEPLMPYFHDVAEHAHHGLEMVDRNRERVDRIVQSMLTEQSAQLNETTRRLAAWAAIIAVPTAVTGFYGQNVPYPGSGTAAGFVTSVCIMVGLGAALWWLLRRSGWL